MSCDPVKNPCPVTCPKVREQLRKAIKEFPNVTDGIFPRKKNDVKPRFLPNIISRDMRDESKQIQKPTITPTEKIIDFDEKKIDMIKGKELAEGSSITSSESVTSIEEIVDHDEEEIDYVKKDELIQRSTIVEEEITSMLKETDHNEKKIDFTEKKNSVVKEVAAEVLQKVPVAIDELQITEDDIKLAPTTQMELESSRKEENFELEEHMEYSEEESITDYEKFIDEELQESLPAVIAREIPEEPRAVRREISRNAATLYERIDRERPVRLPREREAVTAMSEERPIEGEISVKRALANSRITEQTISHKSAEDVCEETCPLVKQQKGKQIINLFKQIFKRIMRKLKKRQQIVDHYYLRGFNYFEDVCTCSLACMMYTLSRDPFIKSIFASLGLFAVGLKLCSELDAWEMPSRIS